MATLYLTEPYAYVKKRDDCLVVQLPDKTTREVPLIKVDQVVVMGDITLTTPALQALLEQGVEICYLSAHGEYHGRLSPPFSKNTFIRRKQYAACADADQTLRLAQQFVGGKLENQRTMLLRGNRKLDETAIAEAATVLKRERAQVGHATTLDSLRGMEGNGAAAYFGVFGRLLRYDLGFARRVRRPPTDPVNALLGLAYTALMNQVLGAIQIVGLDPYAGYLHAAQYARPSLALDIMEEFRAVVADSVVITLINNRVVQAEDFVEELGAVRLKKPGKKLFYEQFEARLNTEIQHPVFGYKATYRRCLELQVRLLAKALEGDIPVYPPFTVR
jgi:CRISPR-associated protein Cas1